MPNRIYSQYKKPKTIEWYEIIPTIVSDLYSVHEETRFSYDIDRIDVTSYELDVIGHIVGVNRSFESEVVFNPTQFGNITDQFGNSNSEFGNSKSNITQNVNNEIFKLLIKAKISKNNGNASLDNISTALQFIVSQSEVHVIDNENMTFSVSFGSTLTSIERMVLTQFDVIPRPQGVQFLGFTEETMITQFGGDLPFGDNRAQFGYYFI